MDGTIIELDRTRTLHFTNSALKQAEMIALKETGASITKLLQEQAMFYVVPLLLWAGLRKEDPGLTRARVDTLTESRLTECGEAVAEALERSGIFAGEPGNVARA